MYGVLGEHPTDAEMIRLFVRRLAYNGATPVRIHGYEGCGQMLTKGAAQLRSFKDQGCTRFIVCYDTDRASPSERLAEAQSRIIDPAKLPANSWLVLIPTEEIEAWILADGHHAVPHLFRTWTMQEIANPEQISSPKEHLEKLSRTSQHRERYAHTLHNLTIAPYLDLQRIARICPSFRPLVEFVQGAERPHPSPALLALAPGQIRAWVQLGTTAVDAGQIGTSAQWKAVGEQLMRPGRHPPQLLSLVERSWAPLALLREELSSITLPKGIRPLLGMLMLVASNHPDANQIGVTDGSRPDCPDHPTNATPTRTRPRRR